MNNEQIERRAAITLFVALIVIFTIGFMAGRFGAFTSCEGQDLTTIYDKIRQQGYRHGYEIGYLRGLNEQQGGE